MTANSESIYATMPDWCALSGMRPSRTYDELSRGNLRAKKIGKRLLIDVQHGLAWLRTLPEPNINLARTPRAAAAPSDPDPTAHEHGRGRGRSKLTRHDRRRSVPSPRSRAEVRRS